jgi:hypothetical protein
MNKAAVASAWYWNSKLPHSPTLTANDEQPQGSSTLFISLFVGKVARSIVLKQIHFFGNTVLTSLLEGLG